MKVKVLGSVSPFSYEEKKGISFLVSSGNDKVLLDLGEGATSNLKVPEDLENLSIIITHLHRDHFCGLLPLSYLSYVYNKHNLLKDKIKVYVPNDKTDEVKKFVKSLEEDSIFDIVFYDEKETIKIGNMDISFKKTIHGPLTFAVKIVSNDKTLVYSADTGYKGNPLESFAKNANLFICESTFLKDEKKVKDVHLTTVEAANIAKNANVSRLLLCHFWPANKKSCYLKEAKVIFKHTNVAKENEEYEI